MKGKVDESQLKIWVIHRENNWEKKMKYLNEETKVFKESGNYSKREYWEERNGI